MDTRRAFLAGSLGAGIAGGLSGLMSCGGHKRATGFSGYAFIANQEGGAIAVVDLEVFAVARHIRVDGSPSAVLANARSARVYALTTENGSVHEIRTANLTFARSCKWLLRPSKCGFRRMVTRYTSCAKSPGSWCA